MRQDGFLDLMLYFINGRLKGLARYYRTKENAKLEKHIVLFKLILLRRCIRAILKNTNSTY